ATAAARCWRGPTSPRRRARSIPCSPTPPAASNKRARTMHTSGCAMSAPVLFQRLATSRVPKLFVKAEPGLLVAGGAIAPGLPAQAEVTVAGLHFLQEDSPDEIGRALGSYTFITLTFS